MVVDGTDQHPREAGYRLLFTNKWGENADNWKIYLALSECPD